MKEYEKMCRDVYLGMTNKRTEKNPEGQTGRIISRENIFVRDALIDVLGSDKDF